MKKMIVSILTLAFALSLSACGETENPSSAGSNTSSETAAVSGVSSSDVGSAADPSSVVTSKAESKNNSKAPVNSKAESKNISKAPVNSKTESKSTSKITSTAEPAGKFASVQEYLADPDVKKELDALCESMSQNGMNMKITGEGSKLIYTYIFAEQLDAAQMKPALEEALVSQESVFTMTADQLKLVVDVKKPIVVVRYVNADKSVILEKEYSAK